MASWLPWAALLVAAAWARWPGAGLLAAAALVVVSALLVHRGAPLGRRTALILVLASVVCGFVVQQRDTHLTGAWDEYWFDREAEVVEELGAYLDEMLDRTIASVVRLADEASGGNLPPAERVRSLRRQAGLAALALYAPAPTPLGAAEPRLAVWDGLHRGAVPQVVKAGEAPFLFGESPLFSYLYVTAPVEGGGTAVAAVLLRADVPGRAGDVDDLASSFHRRTGESLRLSTPARATPPGGVGASGVFDYMHEDMALFSLSVERPSQAERRAEVREGGRLWSTALVVGAWLLLGVAGEWRRAPRLGLATGIALGLLVPVEVVPGFDRLASPGDFLLPLLPGATLARMVAVGLFVVPLAGAVHRGRGGRVPRGVGALVAALAIAGAAVLFRESASVGFLAGSEGGWVAYQAVLAALAALLALAAISLAPPRGVPRSVLALAVGLTVVLALVSGGVALRTGSVPPWLPLLWAFPLGVLAGVDATLPHRRRWLQWGLAVVLGASVAVPVSWGHRLEARLASAASQVSRVGTGVDPYLRFLLERLAVSVDSLDQAGAPAVELLYLGWRSSGLAEAGYPVWMTVWSETGGFPEEELRVGMGGVGRPVVANRYLAEARAGDTVQVRRFDSFEAHYLAQVPLRDDRVMTAVVPPLGTTGAESLLGPLFGSLAPDRSSPLRLVPLGPEEPARPSGRVQWTLRQGGWQGEVVVEMAGEGYIARYDVPVANLPVLVARAVLLVLLDGVLLGVLWWIGGRLAGSLAPRGGARWSGVTSFRARVTVALFAFFALSNLVFGSLAYRSISGAAQRAARVLAERAVNDAAASYSEVGGAVDLLASRVGVEVLEYRHGELREASVDELLSLGLYEGWVPYEVHHQLARREALTAVASTTMGGWEYVTAYRWLQDGDVVGSPVPIQAGATAIQSRDVAELLSAAVVVGAALSFLLALLVGRALTRPIHTLRIASERVGSGNLDVRLTAERNDEFGTVFEAFNRMVRRLRRARLDLVRTTRRTQAIVEVAATGVVAFDSRGVVTLANPTARALLGLAIEEGEPLPPATGHAGDFVRWMATYFRDGLGDAALELQDGERRIRVRARRISHEGPLAGAVVSLEDVTDELRTERVLAWGEMARQVAHEVKNPLTPIKLSVQHLRRAWEDRRPDFDEILTRNAEAMLREIDRLAAIATSFSRFGAPRAVGEEPLAPVELARVVPEVLALYGEGEGAVAFVAALDPDLPPVLARDSEVKEVLINLLENSRAAVREGGTVRVEAVREGEGVVLRVVDDGSGIAEELLGRVFEPHFSTRSSGTGLGLAIVRRLVTGWGASVEVDSRVGEGTVMSIRFSGAGGTPPPSPPRGTGPEAPIAPTS